MRIILLLLLLCGVSSCAFLGTRARIYPGVPASELRAIGFTVQDWPERATSQFGHAVDSVIVQQLMQQLTQVSGRDVYFVGHLRYREIDVQVADSLAKANPRLDAIALCTIQIFSASANLEARCNASAKIYMIKTAERALLARASFNTRLGKSYWLNPTVLEAIEDATKGVTVPFRHYFGT